MILDGEQERILVVRFSSLGDILLTAPALRALRRRFPSAQIDFLVASQYRDAVELLPAVNNIIFFDKSTGWKGLWKLCRELSNVYNVLIDLQNNFRSVFLRSFTFPTFWIKAKRYRFKRWLLIQFKWNIYREIKSVAERYGDAIADLGGELDELGLEFQVSDEYQEWVENFLVRNGILEKSFIVLCPGARHATKRWPEEKWVELGNLLGQNFKIIVMGSKSEADLISRVASKIPQSTAISDWSIPQAAALLHKSFAVVSNDSGLMHLASGVNAPLVAIFGPTVPEFGFYPYKARSQVIDHIMTCRPCTAMGSEKCPLGHFKCMMQTHPQRVLEAIQNLTS